VYAKQRKGEEILEVERRQSSLDVNSTKNRYLARQIYYANPDVPCMRIQYAIPPRGPRTGPPDLHIELTKNSKGRQLRARHVSPIIPRAQKRD
jgi:hypothetical protein